MPGIPSKHRTPSATRGLRAFCAQVSDSLRAELQCVTIGTQLRHFPLFQDTGTKALAKLSVLAEVGEHRTSGHAG